MPYSKVTSLPPAVKALPKHAQEIYKSAFNAAFEKYGEERAHAIAWAAVKQKYKKEGDRWVSKDGQMDLEEYITFDAEDIRFTDDGYMVVTPRVARTGIQTYRGYELGDMREEVRVYRPETSVMDATSMKSFAHRPITVGHPPEMVNSKNWKKYSVGQTGDEIVRDGDFIRVPMVLMDEAVITKAKSGKIRQLSVGYTSELDFHDGLTPSGEQYDAVQRGIRANHIAIVTQARGGPFLRLGDDNDDEESEMNIRAFVIDGMELQLGETEGAVIARSFSRLSDELKTSATNVEKLTTQLDGLNGELTTTKKTVETKDGEIAVLKQQLKDAALTPDKLDARVNERLAVAAKAKAILGDSFDPAGKDDLDIKKLCVSKHLGDAVASAMSEATLDGAFMAITANLKPAATTPAFGARQLADALTPARSMLDERTAAWEERGKQQREAWRTPVGRSN